MINSRKKEKEDNEKLISQKIENSVNKILDENYSNKVNESINKIKEDINHQIKEINNIKNKIEDKEYFKNKINENEVIKNVNQQINLIKEKIKDNYIILKMQINKEDIEADIRIINQCLNYNYLKNFELDDIDIEINNEKIPIKYTCDSSDNLYNDNSESSCGGYSDIYNTLTTKYLFYWNFMNEGLYTIKIIFKKQLSSCKRMFYDCENIIEADLSKFDCSKVFSCQEMFYDCSNIKKIHLGNLDFSFVNYFNSMFRGCKNLIDLDVSNLNTKNSKSFAYMFSECCNLSKIDVSKFDSSNCEDIRYMFDCCSNLTEIDMINWDMSNILYYGKYENFKGLFFYCEKLKKIKISGNFRDTEKTQQENISYKKHKKGKKRKYGDIFDHIAEKGELITNKNLKCNIPLDKYLPNNWSIL